MRNLHFGAPAETLRTTSEHPDENTFQPVTECPPSWISLFSVSLVETEETSSTCPYFITLKLLFCCQGTEGASHISLCSHSTKIRTFFSFSTAQCLHMKEKPWDTCRAGDKPVVWTHFHQEEQESPQRPVGFWQLSPDPASGASTNLYETYPVTIKRENTGLQTSSQPAVCFISLPARLLLRNLHFLHYMGLQGPWASGAGDCASLE